MDSTQKLKFMYAATRYLRLDDKAKQKHYCVFIAMLWHSETFEPSTCVPSIRLISQMSHCGITTAKEAISDLKQWGVVTSKARFNNSNIYTVNWQSLKGAEEVAGALAKYDYDGDIEKIVMRHQTAANATDWEQVDGSIGDDSIADARTADGSIADASIADASIVGGRMSTKLLSFKDLKLKVSSSTASIDAAEQVNKGESNIGHLKGVLTPSSTSGIERLSSYEVKELSESQLEDYLNALPDESKIQEFVDRWNSLSYTFKYKIPRQPDVLYEKLVELAEESDFAYWYCRSFEAYENSKLLQRGGDSGKLNTLIWLLRNDKDGRPNIECVCNGYYKDGQGELPPYKPNAAGPTVEGIMNQGKSEGFKSY